MNIRFLLFLIIVFSIGCQNSNTPLYKAMEKIEASWTEEQQKEFVNKPDSIALNDVHFGYGLNFRNQYLRNPKDSALVKYFNSLGIYHEDYMSGIVFTSLHRKLNNKAIDLESQLKLIYFAMNEINKLETKNTQRALKNYNKYFIGDTIVVRMPVNKYGHAVRHSYPDDNNRWAHNDSLDFLIKGTIIEKTEILDTLDILFKLKVISMNNDKVNVFMEDIHINDTIEVDLRLDIIENFDNSN